MTIKQLSYFLAVVDTGRFTQAAALCRVAQPTLSKQIRSLEEDLGETLVTRGHDNVTPTAAGEALLPLARRIVADSETARMEIAELAGLRKGRLRLGATPSLCVSVVADVLEVFHGRYPGIALQVSEGGSQDLVADLQRGQLDVALVIDRGVTVADLALTPVLREELRRRLGAGVARPRRPHRHRRAGRAPAGGQPPRVRAARGDARGVRGRRRDAPDRGGGRRDGRRAAHGGARPGRRDRAEPRAGRAPDAARDASRHVRGARR